MNHEQNEILGMFFIKNVSLFWLHMFKLIYSILLTRTKEFIQIHTENKIVNK